MLSSLGSSVLIELQGITLVIISTRLPAFLGDRMLRSDESKEIACHSRLALLHGKKTDVGKNQERDHSNPQIVRT